MARDNLKNNKSYKTQSVLAGRVGGDYKEEKVWGGNKIKSQTKRLIIVSAISSLTLISLVAIAIISFTPAEEIYFKLLHTILGLMFFMLAVCLFFVAKQLLSPRKEYSMNNIPVRPTFDDHDSDENFTITNPNYPPVEKKIIHL
jgi:hypothetical protein